VRGTWSTSFLAPTLYQRYRQNVQFGASVDDVLTPQNDNLSRIPALVSGNPLLEPQSSENYNLGFTLRPWDGWSFDVDYWHFTFDDQISLESANALALDVNSALDPTKVIRDPTAGVVMWNGVNVGPIVGFNLSYFNNNSLETAGFDFTINNTQDLGAFGSLSNTLMATHQSTYKLDGRDLTGGRNGRVSGASISVPWRATLRTSWALGNHSAQSLVRFTDGFANDTLPNAGTAAKLHIPKYLVWDLSYTYDLGDRFGMKSSSVALGLNNVMDKGGIWVPDGNHTLSSMYDYSGRHIWLRLKAGF
jgi:iron complex outermembrane receptor protein